MSATRPPCQELQLPKPRMLRRYKPFRACCASSAPRAVPAAAPQQFPQYESDEVVNISRRCMVSTSLVACSFTSLQGWAGESPDKDLQATINEIFDKTAGRAKAPVLLRLVFHDAGTYSRSGGGGGANASVRFELKRPENAGLNRGWRVIEETMRELKGGVAEGRVSYADLIAFGGAYAVQVTSGPPIRILPGRQDAVAADPSGRLPSERAPVDEILQIFADKGFSTQEFVALSGAHTLGSKGFGDPVTFDNEYFRTLQRRPWADGADKMAAMIGLPSDQALPDSPACAPAIARYAASQPDFFADFAAAFTKLAALGSPLS